MSSATAHFEPWLSAASRAFASAGFGGLFSAAGLWVFALLAGEFNSGLEGLILSLLVFVWVIPAVLVGFVPVLLTGEILIRAHAGWLWFACLGALGGGLLAAAVNWIEDLPLTDGLSFLMILPAGVIAMLTYRHLEKEITNG